MINRFIHTAQKAFIIDKTRTKLLLLKHKSDKYMNDKLAGKYGFPGGKIDFSETPDQALIREVEEETSISVIPGIPFYTYSWTLTKEDKSQHQINAVVRLITKFSGSPTLANNEVGSIFSEVAFVPISELSLDNMIFDELPAVEKYLEYKKTNPFV